MGNDLSERETRKLIDEHLVRTGWRKEYILEEVNSVKSDFGAREYVLFDGDVGHGDRYIDYLLLDEGRNPLAIVEAKRTSVDVGKGEIQSKTYQEDVEKGIGFKIPIFLTNGKEWFFVDEKYRKREVVLPFSQGDLKRRVSLVRQERDLGRIKINGDIVDRQRSMRAVKEVLEHFAGGHRKALVTMATGTGKTRVAMAVIDALIRAGYVRRVLFVTDRISLTSNAKEEGFKEFIPSEPVCELNTEGFSDSARMYVSTVQTLMSGVSPRGKFYERFGVGAFDLVVFDEAHRSYYDRNNDVMRYFDSLVLGLTATPSSGESRNTYDLFGCDGGVPTVEYSYGDAVREGDLVPYVTQTIETKVLALGIKGSRLSKDLKDELKRQEEDPDVAELPGSRFERYFTDERTNQLILSEFMDRCYKTPDGTPCKTIFFCVSVKHAECLKRLFDGLYPSLSGTARVITSNRTRYMDEVKRFKKSSDPRVVFSVGVLDTGVNIPEVCNLVFVKPVFSSIRFWQMLGRGTRNFGACKHRDWLPQRNGFACKDDFLILDFQFGDHSNVVYHKLGRGKVGAKSDNVKMRIFLKQVDLLGSLEGREKEIVSGEILDSVRAIDVGSPMVVGKRDVIRRVVSAKFDLEKHIDELKNEVAPLLVYSKSENSAVYTFVNRCVGLFGALRDGKRDEVFKVERFVKGRVRNVWERNLDVVRDGADDLKRVLGDGFWDGLTFEDVDFLVRRIAPFMVYYEADRKRMLRVDYPDYVIDVKEVKMEIRESEDFSYFVSNNDLMRKIRDGRGVTADELLEIEGILSGIDPKYTIENIQNGMDFVVFLRKVLDINDLPDPQEMIKREFGKFVIDRNEHYSSGQMRFLEFLRDFFVRVKHIRLEDFAEHPFTEERPLDLFSADELRKIVLRCNGLRWR